MLTPRQALPKDWTRHLTGGPIGLGLDLATTANKLSNPSSITVSQQEGNMIHERLVIRWKTTDDRVTKAIARLALQDIADTRRKPRALSIDASNEVFLCRQLKRELSKFCAIHLIASGAVTQWKGEEITHKILLGNLYAALFEDQLITIPNVQWLIDDHRLVQRDKGTFKTDLGPNGEHGDTFDSGKLSYWSLLKKGRADLHAAHISSSPATTNTPSHIASQLKNWLAKKSGINLSGQRKGVNS
jgi:hypothetical protein